MRLNILTRKTLGGLETDLSSRVLQPAATRCPGVYAAGEVAGFGGGGMHGYRSLEGTFLGGCIFSGRTAGRADRPDGQEAPNANVQIPRLRTPRSAHAPERPPQRQSDGIKRRVPPTTAGHQSERAIG